MRGIPYLVIVILGYCCAPTYAASLDEARVRLTVAQEAQQKSIASEGGWISTDELLKQAEESLKKGDAEKASTLAQSALREAQLSLTQAQQQRLHWSEPPYIRHW